MAKLTPMKAIREKCLECSAHSPYEVKMCLNESCSLHPYRLGKNPSRKGIGGNPNLSKNSPT